MNRPAFRELFFASNVEILNQIHVLVMRRQFSKALKSANTILGSAQLVGADALIVETLHLHQALMESDQDGAKKFIQKARRVLDTYRP
nr:hypothetical protein [uncultured Hyphomonas sp.]